ncbi:MAG: hypothetical protein OEY41_07220, partial [Acidimicrobiia bacterium]|nr:hypothetical protein [Acidimicrobiia bacterium]
VPPELEAIVAKLMARNPNDRFSRASAVQEALVRLRANQPSSSRPFTGPAPVVPPAAWPAPPAAPSSHPPPGPEGRAVPPNPPVQERAVPPTPPPNPPRPGAPLTPAPPLPGAPVAPVPPRPGPAFDAGITTPAAMGGTGSSPGSSNPDAATHLRPPDPPVGAVAGPPLDPALIAVVSAPTPAGLSRPPVPDLGEAPGADSQAVATQRPTPGPAAAPASPGPSDIHEAGTVRAGREPPPDRGAQATERVTSGPDAAAGIHEARTIRADAGEPDAHPTPGDAPGPAVPVTTPPDVHEARTVRVDPDAGPTVWVGPEPPLRPAGPSSGAVPASADGQATVRIPPPASGPGGESADPPSSGSAALGGPMPLGGPVPPPPPGPRPVSGPLLARPPGSLPAGRPVPASEPPVPPAPATPARASSGPLRAPALDVPPGGTGPGPLAAPPDRSGPVLERVRRSGRSRVLSLIVVAAVMVTVGLLVATGAGPFGTSDDGTAGDSADGRPQAAITVASATSFDPQSRDAEKLEREDLVTRAFDGDRSTAWSTETYRREDFGGLKDGVGLLLALDDTATVHTVDLVTNTVGYTLEIYVGDSFGPDPSSWGDPAAQLGDGPATASLDLIDARGSMVLVWIRDTGRTGQKFRFELAEVALR